MIRFTKYKLALLSSLLLFYSARAQEKTSECFQQLLTSKAGPRLLQVLNHPDSFQYQLIYTVIDRDKENRPSFTNHYLHVDANRYFNPASTVKLPTALMALQKINSLYNLPVNKYSSMLTDSAFSGQTKVLSDTSSITGFPSIAHYIKKIFLVSDNDAYNRLYEFTGQQYLNENLWAKGFPQARIVRRFTPMNEEENRNTNPIRFMDGNRLLYRQSPIRSNLSFDYSKQIFIGNGYLDRNDSLIRQPMDFTRHNNLPLETLHEMVRRVIFPETVPPANRFDLTPDDYRFLWQYMSELPSESKHPAYDTTEFFDSYTKFFWFKADKQKIPEQIRSFNKTGWSYGFLTDAAYIVDFKNKIEFLISGVIYVNRDAILNDNKYEYTEIGYPFFRDVGKIIYEYELSRKRKYSPDLSRYKFDYNKP